MSQFKHSKLNFSRGRALETFSASLVKLERGHAAEREISMEEALDSIEWLQNQQYEVAKRGLIKEVPKNETNEDRDKREAIEMHTEMAKTRD